MSLTIKLLKRHNFIETKSLTEEDFLYFKRKYSWGKLLPMGIFIIPLFWETIFMLSIFFFKTKNLEPLDTVILLLTTIPLLFVSLVVFVDFYHVFVDERKKIKFVGFGVLKEKSIRTHEDSADSYILTIQLEHSTLTAYTDNSFFEIIEIDECIFVEFLPKSKKVISIIYKDRARNVL